MHGFADTVDKQSNDTASFEVQTGNHSKHAIRRVAALHQKTIDQGFLSRLGLRFLIELYQAINDSPEGIIVTAKVNGEIVGFVAGATSSGAIYRHLVSHQFFRTGFSLIPQIFFPSVVKKVWETMRYAKSDQSSKNIPTAELLSIAVDEHYGRHGIAGELYKALNDEFQQLDIDAFKIVVGARLNRANRFYQKMGALVQAETEVHQNSKSYIYVAQYE